MKNMDKRDKWFFLCLVGIIFLLYGARFNLLVIENNNYKMPVLFSHINYETNEHFSFNIDNKPKFWYLSDIIKIGDYIFSIGDLLLIIGMFLVSISIGNYSYIILKERKK